MTISQESAQKALNSLDVSDKPTTSKTGQAYRDLRDELLSDCVERHMPTIRAALQHFAQPSGEGVERSGAYKAVETILTQGVPDETQRHNGLKYLAELMTPSPASPPDAVAQAIETLELAIRTFRFHKFGSSIEVCENALTALRTLPARQDGWRPIETEPTEGFIWVWGPALDEPERILADGEWRRYALRTGASRRLTYWMPANPPAPPATPAAAMGGEGGE